MAPASAATIMTTTTAFTTPATESATRRFVRTFGILAAFAGAEHGLGEILQTDRRLDGRLLLSWPDSGFFRIVGGEPAMTLLPTPRVAGLATLALSAGVLWVALRAGRFPRRGPILAVVSVLLLLAGGGFGPPLLGLIVAGLAGRARLASRRCGEAPHPRLRRPGGIIDRLGARARGWYLVAVASWLVLLPGAPLLDQVVAVPDTLVVAVIVAAFAALGMAAVAGVAHDRQAGMRRFSDPPTPEARTGRDGARPRPAANADGRSGAPGRASPCGPLGTSLASAVTETAAPH